MASRGQQTLSGFRFHPSRAPPHPARAFSLEGAAVRTMLVAKIHGATVTEANLEYEGSITLDPILMDAVGLIPYEQVHVLDLTNGARLETYAIVGREGSGEVCINGAAAHLVDEGDKVIVLSYHQLDDADARDLAPRIVYLGADNVIERRARGEGIRHREHEPLSVN